MPTAERLVTHFRPSVLGLLGVTLASLGAVSSWKAQEWRYGQQLERQAKEHALALNQEARNNAARQLWEQNSRKALEQRLQSSEQTHYRELSDAQKNQVRLRDRLATTELRLSVLLNTTDPSRIRPTASGSLVHGAPRAELDPAHAQRIIGITDDGDRGLIALAACQAYVREVSDSPSVPSDWR